MNETETPIEVTLAIGLDTVIGAGYHQTGEDTYATEPTTILDAVIREVARQLVATLIKDVMWAGVRESVKNLISATAQARVNELVTGELERVWQPVDEQGVPTKARTSLVRLITASAEKALTVTPGSAGYGRSEPSVLSTFIEQTTERAIAKELAPALDAAKAALVDRVASSFSHELAARLVVAAVR